jgi:hypothetical protein
MISHAEQGASPDQRPRCGFWSVELWRWIQKTDVPTQAAALTASSARRISTASQGTEIRPPSSRANKRRSSSAVTSRWTLLEGNTLTLGETKFARVRAHPPLLGRQRTLGATGCQPPALAIGPCAGGDRREGPQALHRYPGRVSVGARTAETGERRLAPTGA